MWIADESFRDTEAPFPRTPPFSKGAPPQENSEAPSTFMLARSQGGFQARGGKLQRPDTVGPAHCPQQWLRALPQGQLQPSGTGFLCLP